MVANAMKAHDFRWFTIRQWGTQYCILGSKSGHPLSRQVQKFTTYENTGNRPTDGALNKYITWKTRLWLKFQIFWPLCINNSCSWIYTDKLINKWMCKTHFLFAQERRNMSPIFSFMIKRRHLAGKQIAFQVCHLFTGKVAVHLSLMKKKIAILPIAIYMQEKNFGWYTLEKVKRKENFFPFQFTIHDVECSGCN